MAAPMDNEMAEAQPDDESAEGESSLAGGYCVELHVMPDGTFRVSGPEPLEQEAAEGESPDEGEPYQSIGEALKGILKVVRDNPPEQDEQAHFNAGLGEAQ
jgi:hypothetical protein